MWTAIQNGSLDELSEGLCVFDRNHRLLAWNESFRKLLGLPQKSLKRRQKLSDIVAYAVSRGDFTRHEGDRILASWQSASIKAGKRVSGWPRKNKRALTSVRRRAEGGQTIFILKEPDDSVGDRYRQLIDESAQGILIHRDGIILYVNDAIAKFSPLGAEELIGSHLEELIRREDMLRIEQRIAAGGSSPIEFMVEAAAGRKIWVEARSANIEWDGEPASQVVMLDVTERKSVEETLLRQAIVLNQISEGVLIASADGEVTECNPSACRILGYERDELIGKNAYQILTPEFEAAGLPAEIEAGILADQPWFGTVSIVRGDGSQCTIDGSVLPRRDATGAIVGRIGVVRDVTEQKKADEQLQLQATVIEQMSEAVLITNDSDIILDANRAAVNMFGKGHRDFVGSRLDQLISLGSPVSDGFSEMEESIFKIGVVSGEITVGEGADERQIEVSSTPLQSPEDRSVGRIVVCRDVTDRRASEIALRQSERKFRDLIEGSLQGVMIYDFKRILYVNRAATEIFGYSVDDMIGMEIDHVMLEEERGTVSESQLTPITGPKTLPARRSDGAQVWVEFIACDIEWEGRAARQVTLFDVTDRHDAQEALLQAQKMESLGQLTGGIAHDFNNLLGVVSGNLELLREQIDESDDKRGYIDTGLRSVRRGAELTQRLLAFARKQPLRPEYTDLNELIASLTKMLRRSLGERIEVETDLASDAWPTWLDQGQMENVLLNLALNARDAMPQGGKLGIKTENLVLTTELVDARISIPPGNYLKLTVRDNGTGIAPDVLASVFDPFFTTKEVGSGSGLGLSMAHGFVNQSNGHIRIVSQVGKGTDVELYVPRSESPAPTKISRSSVSSPRGNNETVLVVEDDDDLRDLAVILLSRMGYKTLEAADGSSAIALMEKVDHVDLLFTDVVLPRGISGVDVARKAKERFSDIKVLFTSGYAQSESFVSELQKDDVELIRKPYRTETLAKRLQAVLAD